MPSSSAISLRRAAVGLRSAAKKRSRWVSCSGVTRERLRFSLESPDFLVGAEVDADDVERVRCGPDAGSLVSESMFGVSGGASADKDTLSAGVFGDIEALGEDEDESAMME